jgi:hypothetical protein
VVENRYESSQRTKCSKGELDLETNKDKDFKKVDIKTKLEESFGSNKEKKVKAPK